ncbi:MAG: hypothetical protein OEM52_00840, partial [bacterium]|nr:hypothetical protein [bacterium]
MLRLRRTRIAITIAIAALLANFAALAQPAWQKQLSEGDSSIIKNWESDRAALDVQVAELMRI